MDSFRVRRLRSSIGAGIERMARRREVLELSSSGHHIVALATSVPYHCGQFWNPRIQTGYSARCLAKESEKPSPPSSAD
jgi:hypothetical protein